MSAVPDEDWSAPESGEDSQEGGDPELYGDAEPVRSRTGETRVASIDSVRPEEEEPPEEEDNSETTRAGPPVMMLVLDGVDKGRKKRFKGVRMVVGRSNDCDFALKDQTVSRRHLELVYGESGVVMRDLGGISGTLVNDQKVDECILKHGDEISVGKTRLRFVDEGELIKEMRAKAESGEADEEKKEKKEEKKDPRLDEKTNANYKLADLMRDEKARKTGVPRPRPVRSSAREGFKPTFKMKVGAAVGGLLLLMLILGLALSKGSQPPPKVVDPNLVRAQELMQRARDKVRDGEYPDAVRFAQEAEKLRVGIDVDGVAKAAQELQDILDSFQAVRGLMAENRYPDARAKLTATPQSNVAARLDGERKKLEEELESKEQAYTLSLLETALTERRPDDARTLIPELPQATRYIYEQKLADLEALLAKEAQQAARQAGVRQAVAAENAKQRRAEFVAEAFQDVERRFNGGDFQRATLEVDRVMDKFRGEADIQARARNLKKLIPQFRSAFEEGQKKYENNSLEASVKPLRRAVDVYRQIGFAGSLGDTLDNELASASVAAGQAAFKRKEYPLAGRSFREALRLNPGDSRARDGLDELQKKVEELYLSAYISRDRDPALATEQFKIVIESSAEGADVKRKAEMALSELQKAGGS
ncbi:FHA domain-containing protein [Corallococcus aberystwythensis]|uniref:FHA domain-containing protein n=1 Tax=Corallococcus aberystwythensis TaxID=2316722 RepID=UPI001FC99D7F|nr:FHA domain-containing protein [Corallococcus aberystwythensis]